MHSPPLTLAFISADFNGTRFLVRADLKWIFEVYLGASVLEKYGFLVDRTNDLTLNLFAELREEIEVAQLVEVRFDSKLKSDFVVREN